MVLDGFAGKIELGECVEAEHAGAVHRVADLVVLFENEDRRARSAASGRAALSPAGPAPTTMTSHSRVAQNFR